MNEESWLDPSRSVPEKHFKLSFGKSKNMKSLGNKDSILTLLVLTMLMMHGCCGGGGVSAAEYLPDDDDDGIAGGTQYKHFIAMNDTQTCVGDSHATPFNNQIRGVCLGGWMVLEPWITPSLFYQFLGGNETTTAFDTYTFCEVLGPVEANKQLRKHWETWVTEDIIQELADSGAVNSLRLPVGDYMYKPYGPYVGCFDGALEYVDTLLDWAYARGLNVLFDIHTMKDSQNGFDNSGQAMGFKWTGALNSEFGGLTTFEHWPIRSARWMGEFDQESATYTEINHENIQHGLHVIEKLVKTYSGHPAVLGLEPLNEPWQFTPIEELKSFYWEGYLIVKKYAPYWKYVMHDSFRLDPNIWGGFMAGCPERALDTHIYQAWRDPDSRIGFYNDACGVKRILAQIEEEFGPVIVGEWSLATTNCAMWLNGFNDNLPGFPRLPCKYIPCSDPYMGFDQPGTPVDPTKAIQGPYGTGMSGPIFGLCPVDRDWIKESSGNPQTGHDWVRSPPNAPRHLDDTDNVMTHLAQKKINAFSGVGHGFYFWNFRTDLYEPQWSYMLALDRGWIPRGSLNYNDQIRDACIHEDAAEFRCILKRDATDDSIHKALSYILKTENSTTTTTEQTDILSMKGQELYDHANSMISQFFDNYKHDGTTCDFGGIALLIELNSTTITTDDDVLLNYNDDEYYFTTTRTVYKGFKTFDLLLMILISLIFGSIIGFIIAMRSNKQFNKAVRQSTLYRSISRTNNSFVKNSFVRSSLALPDLMNDANEIQGLVANDRLGDDNTGGGPTYI